jgi:hypothetical protein
MVEEIGDTQLNIWIEKLFISELKN